MIGNINDWYEPDIVDGKSSIRSKPYILKRGNLSWMDPWLNTKYGWQLRNSQMEGINFEGMFSLVLISLSILIIVEIVVGWRPGRPNECNAMLFLIWQLGKALQVTYEF